jgi:hypothetical protein
LGLVAADATGGATVIFGLALQDTIVAIRKGGDKLVVGNLESDKYPTIEFSTDPSQVC